MVVAVQQVAPSVLLAPPRGGSATRRYAFCVHTIPLGVALVAAAVVVLASEVSWLFMVLVAVVEYLIGAVVLAVEARGRLYRRIGGTHASLERCYRLTDGMIFAVHAKSRLADVAEAAHNHVCAKDMHQHRIH